jgi:hypothetical protein
MSENTNPVEELRQNTIEAFFAKLDQNNIPLSSERAELFIGEVADERIPGDQEQRLALMGTYYNGCPYYLMLQEYEESRTSLTPADAMASAIGHFLELELFATLQQRREEEKEKEEEQRNHESSVVAWDYDAGCGCRLCRAFENMAQAKRFTLSENFRDYLFEHPEYLAIILPEEGEEISS